MILSNSKGTKTRPKYFYSQTIPKMIFNYLDRILWTFLGE